MRRWHMLAGPVSFAILVLAGCNLPGKPKPSDIPVRPESVTSFDVLYGIHCAGCHGKDGQNGPAIALANPEYQALVDDATLKDIITNGQKGTLMPGFGTSSGGDMTPLQIDSLLQGMRAHWMRPSPLSSTPHPPYRASSAGNPANGQRVYTAACAGCHGATEHQPGPAGNLLDGSFLALINDQTLRTIIIAGRPDIGHPDWQHMIPGRAMTDAEITDVTAWLMSQRPARPGQPYPDNQPASRPPGEAQPTAIKPRM